jgi:hypothetical protein
VALPERGRGIEPEGHQTLHGVTNPSRSKGWAQGFGLCGRGLEPVGLGVRDAAVGLRHDYWQQESGALASGVAWTAHGSSPARGQSKKTGRFSTFG